MAIQQSKHFTIIFEYKYHEVTEHTDLLMIRGKKDELGNRPDYITVICNKPKETYVITPATCTAIYLLVCALSPKYHPTFRLTVKPIWFHDLVYKG